MKKYSVYLGSSEQHRYSFEANNIRDLKIEVNETFNWTGSRWYKQDVSTGYPEGSEKYLVKIRKYSRLGTCINKVLVIPS